MIRKGSKLFSILRFKCPHCHEGEFFMSRNPYDLSKAGDIHDTCPVCGRRYTPEPGFYYGAMYVSYALGVALFVGVYLLLALLAPDLPTWSVVTAVLVSLLLLTPLIYAGSKIIWGNLFFSYKGVELTAKERSAAS